MFVIQSYFDSVQFSSVQISPLTNWIVGRTRGTIFHQRSSSGRFCRRSVWAVLAWARMSIRNQVPQETSPHLLLGAQDQRLGAEQDQLPCGSTGTPSDNCQETETFMVRTCHTSQQPLQNHFSGHIGGWATLWSAEEMLDGHHQHQRVDNPLTLIIKRQKTAYSFSRTSV